MSFKVFFFFFSFFFAFVLIIILIVKNRIFENYLKEEPDPGLIIINKTRNRAA